MAQSLFGLDPNRDLRDEALDLALHHRPATPYPIRLALRVYQSAPRAFTAQAPRIAELIATSMQATTDPAQLSWLGRALGELGAGLPAEQAQVGAVRLVEAMGTTTDPRQLSRLGWALGELGAGLPAEQAQAGTVRLVEAMGATTDPRQLSRLGWALGELGAGLPAGQARAGAVRLVEAMGTTTDPWQLRRLGVALGKLGAKLPAEQARAGAVRLVKIMESPIDSNAFASLAAGLGDLPVTRNIAGIDTAPNLLQAPMAFGETREHLLRYYSRLAGVFETPEAFRTTDDLVAWVRAHGPSLDLTRPPRNPFR